ncbi:MAG TPA: alpha-1,4-glucan--maltose-1-phosphate maltosyltransferase [Thermoanaerobaculia bacterium]
MAENRTRVAIEGVQPEIDCGRFPIKRVAGERVVVEADAFAEGHDVVVCTLLHRAEAAPDWTEVAMEPLGNDRWRGAFRVPRPGAYRYTLRAWVDRFATWARDLGKRVAAGQDLAVDLAIGASLVEETAGLAPPGAAAKLRRFASRLKKGGKAAAEAALSPALADLIREHEERRFVRTYPRELFVSVDREKARFSTWYEMFPRSASGQAGRHGTFRDCEALLPEIAEMGFDVLYFPPIHPIGTSFRKGRNGSLKAKPEDPGSPWAIGAAEGGHTAIHPELGTPADFRRLLSRARAHGIEIALDIALQASPEHPYVTGHPDWFRWRPDGTIQYAENPPKKYQDIYPLEFDTDAAPALWEELRRVFLHWIGEGVRIFRVDNPHTKPFGFWEWLITEIHREHRDVLFLSEAFTRPKIMYRLAKLGFTQSYTYFAWRTAHAELAEYFTELTRPPVVDFFRANLWPNTPDILTEYLQTGGLPAFRARLLLAATLGASYGIYGPAFELGVRAPREPGSEEYLDSEKYEIKAWNRGSPDSLRPLVTLVNRIRRENPALQQDRTLYFHATDNDRLLCYSKRSEAGDNVVLAVVNLNPSGTEAGWTDLDLTELGVDPARPFEVEDLLTSEQYRWAGPKNFVALDPARQPAHLLRVRQDPAEPAGPA